MNPIGEFIAANGTNSYFRLFEIHDSEYFGMYLAPKTLVKYEIFDPLTKTRSSEWIEPVRFILEE